MSVTMTLSEGFRAVIEFYHCDQEEKNQELLSLVAVLAYHVS